MTPEEIKDRALELFPRLREWRRTLHQHPELGFDLDWTAAYVAGELRKMGVSPHTGVGISGITVDVGEGEHMVALRADMDALPILEKNDVPYRSLNEGRMHACGHDAHTAMLLGAVKIILEMHQEGKLPGRVRFLFQPNEEGQEQGGGALLMIRDGALDGVETIFGQHVDPELYVGTAATRPGPMMAEADVFRLTVKGRQSHAAYPHQGVDAIAISAHVVSAVHQVVSRRVNPVNPAVVTIGEIHGGTKPNVLAGEVAMTGTIRTFSTEDRDVIEKEIENAGSIAKSLGGDYVVDFQHGTPPLVNDPELTEFVMEEAQKLLGTENVFEAQMRMGGEDFAFYAQKVPGAFVRLGVRAPGERVRPLHTNTFDLDENALPLGAALLSHLAVRWLEEASRR